MVTVEEASKDCLRESAAVFADAIDAVKRIVEFFGPKVRGETELGVDCTSLGTLKPSASRQRRIPTPEALVRQEAPGLPQINPLISPRVAMDLEHGLCTVTNISAIPRDHPARCLWSSNRTAVTLKPDQDEASILPSCLVAILLQRLYARNYQAM